MNIQKQSWSCPIIDNCVPQNADDIMADLCRLYSAGKISEDQSNYEDEQIISMIRSQLIDRGHDDNFVNEMKQLYKDIIFANNNKTNIVDDEEEKCILDDFQNIVFKRKKHQILTSGFIPSSPYFIPDGHFVSTAQILRKISNLDLIDILKFSYLHPEQNFFLPNFGLRSNPLEKWLSIDIGTQFESLATSQWMKLRLKSSLFFYVIGEYLKWISINTAPIKYQEQEFIDPKIQEFLFGVGSQNSSRRTRLILRNHLNVEFLEGLQFPTQVFEEYFWRGFNGDLLQSEELDEIGEELEQRIKKNPILNNARRTIENHGYSIPHKVSKQLADLQNEVSWCREKIRQLEGTDTV
jgi:hypothetical protein